MVVDRCSTTVQRTYSIMSAFVNEATNFLDIPSKVFDGITLSGHVAWWNARYDMSDSRQVLHLVDMEWL